MARFIFSVSIPTVLYPDMLGMVPEPQHVVSPTAFGERSVDSVSNPGSVARSLLLWEDGESDERFQHCDSIFVLVRIL